MSLKTLIAASIMIGGFDGFNEVIKHMPKFKATRGHRIEVRTEPKIGRNEPCTCDSGLKYKKCGALGKCKYDGLAV